MIFRATCDPARRELVVEYYGDGEVRLLAGQSMSLEGRLAVPLRTRLVDGRLEGRTPATPALVAMLSNVTDLDIETPNAMEEAWHVGAAAPLAKVARACAALPQERRSKSRVIREIAGGEPSQGRMRD